MAEASSMRWQGLSVEDFRGDFDELAAVMQHSWVENSSQPLLYTPEFLASYFAYPDADFHLAPALYEDSRLAAFIAGFPRQVRWNGKKLRILSQSFFTVASEQKRRGYGAAVWSEVLMRSRAAGFDGVIGYNVKGELTDNIILDFYQRMKIPAARIFSVHYLTRLISTKQSEVVSEDVDRGFVAKFLQAASRTAEGIPLARIWSRKEAQWQCELRSRPIVASHSVGEQLGILTGYMMHAANREKTQCLLIEDILWKDLGTEERQALVEKLVDQAASAGARIALVPLLGYADPEPFLKARFLRSPRVLNAYFGVWNAERNPEPVSSFYLDVF